MARRIALSILFCAMSLPAADFQDYQAARAVIGQASFSARDKGITVAALSLTKGNLFAAEASGHLLTFDVSHLGSAQTPGCPVCVTAPQASSAQSVFQGIAAVAVSGKTIVIADVEARRVLLWTGGAPAPNVILTGFVRPTAVALDQQRLYVADVGSHHVFVWNQLPTLSSQTPDVTLGVAENADGPNADTLQTPSALASDGVNLYVADAGARRVLVFSAADSAAPEIVNAATLAEGPVAPGTLVSIAHAANKSTVLLNGTALRVTDVNGDQLQVQIPYELSGAWAGSLWLQNEAGSSRAAAIRFTPASPGIFAFGVKEPRTGLLLHAPEGVPLSPENPAKPSDLLTVWATGLGAVAADASEDGSFQVLTPVRASVNGMPAEVVSAALPADATGIYEVRLRVPSQLADAAASLVLTQNESRSNSVTFPVQSVH